MLNSSGVLTASVVSRMITAAAMLAASNRSSRLAGSGTINTNKQTIKPAGRTRFCQRAKCDML